MFQWRWGRERQRNDRAPADGYLKGTEGQLGRLVLQLPVFAAAGGDSRWLWGLRHGAHRLAAVFDGSSVRAVSPQLQEPASTAAVSCSAVSCWVGRSRCGWAAPRGRPAACRLGWPVAPAGTTCSARWRWQVKSVMHTFLDSGGLAVSNSIALTPPGLFCRTRMLRRGARGGGAVPADLSVRARARGPGFKLRAKLAAHRRSVCLQPGRGMSFDRVPGLDFRGRADPGGGPLVGEPPTAVPRKQQLLAL